MSIHACTPTADLIAVPFTLASPGARRVRLALFFNAAPPGPAPLPADPAFRREASTMVAEVLALAEAAPGHWRCEARLRPGPCDYLFLVDGEWVMDPEAPEVRPDGAGGYNAVRLVEREAAGASLPPAENVAAGTPDRDVPRVEKGRVAAPRTAGTKRGRHPAGNFVQRGEKTAWPISRFARPARAAGA